MPATVATEFAVALAGDTGMSAREIVAFFRSYSPTVPSVEAYKPGVPVRRELFISSLRHLQPDAQWNALADLLERPPTMKHGTPTQGTTASLHKMLYEGAAGLFVGTAISQLSVRETKEAWFKALSRLPHSPAAAVTAARAMLEQACQRILIERLHEDPNEAKGDLPRLVKLVCQSLAARDGWRREVASGLVSAAGGIARISNTVGDRHGIADPVLLSEHEAEFLVHAAATITVFFVREHQRSRGAGA